VPGSLARRQAFAAQGHASWIYQPKKVLPASSLRVFRPSGRDVQVTANGSV